MASTSGVIKLDLDQEQLSWIKIPLSSRVFLEGPAGSGKTTASAARMIHLICAGIPGEQILILVPQRTLGFPYQQALETMPLPPGGRPQILTLGGLAQRMVSLFWPLVAEPAGFSRPDRSPVFLTVETAQHILSELVAPKHAQGFFADLRVNPNRLHNQILDNLNKAALNGLNLEEVESRLQNTWTGKTARKIDFAQAVECARDFRTHCLKHNLLDYSLQVELFNRLVWPNPLCQTYIENNFRHLMYDNIEEDTPAAHDWVLSLVPVLESVWLVSDTGGGFRSFLGADPFGAEELKNTCQVTLQAQRSHISTPPVDSMRRLLCARLSRRPLLPDDLQELSMLAVRHSPNYPAMIDSAADEIAGIVGSGRAKPGEIAVLAPYVSDTLDFYLRRALDRHRIDHRSLRPSRSLKTDPLVRCLITWAKLAHPQWKMPPAHEDVREALHLTVANFDLVRAELLAREIYLQQSGELRSTARVPLMKVSRISADVVNLYENTIYQWFGQYIAGEPDPLDIFFGRLFAELLSYPRFRFHAPGPPAELAAILIESAQKFRQNMAGSGLDSQQIARDYVCMVESGVISAQYLAAWQIEDANAVRISPAYTFLMSNQPVSYQLWLDAGSLGWWQRVHQPLTQPYVLNRRWPENRPWTDQDEVEHNQASLERLVNGLMRRCSTGIILFAAGLNESGNEERGPLLTAVQGIMRAQYRQQAGVHE